MLIRGLRQLVFFAASAFLLFFVGAGLYQKELITLPKDIWPPEDGRWPQEIEKQKHEETEATMKAFVEKMEELEKEKQEQKDREFDPQNSHRILYSRSTFDKKYFKVNWGSDHKGYNANILPHPGRNDSFLVVAQRKSPLSNTIWFQELTCDAKFINGELVCEKSPLLLPIGATSGDQCKGKLTQFNNNIGPHDARAFWTPDIPLTVYGSNSKYACFGLWAQDLRTLLDIEFQPYEKAHFRLQTELQRPGAYGVVEKNWFLFWDSKGKMYAHYDLVPHRVYAQLEWDGTAGRNLASGSTVNDVKCLAKYMPKVAKELESIHQSTNSLRIIMCKRTDPTCTPNATNTFIMTIFQHKTYYMYHSVYEPYIMLMKQDSPFDVHAISTKPYWVNGRSMPGEKDQPLEEFQRPDGHTAMFYITSMSWKSHSQKYEGYLDDELLLGFGIEDSRAGGIDILAEDLLQDLGLCSQA